MIEFLQTIVNGVAAGSAYALMGLAMVIIYKTSKVPNFAQGEMALVVTYLTHTLLTAYGLPLHVALAATLALALILGALVEFCVLSRAKTPSVLGLIIITIGLEMVFMGLVSWKFGAEEKTMPFPISPYDSILLGQVYISTLEALIFAVAVVLMVLLFVFFRYSRLGMAMKATQQNETAARVMGIRTRRIRMLTWGISSLVGALAGVLLAPVIMQPYMMWDPMLKGFAAAVLGGMTSLPGAVAGAYILGIVENLFGGYVSIEFKSVVAFAIIVLVLCVRPSGLFARHYVKKV
jgi:branched-chain amino acid transport system permease protein